MPLEHLLPKRLRARFRLGRQVAVDVDRVDDELGTQDLRLTVGHRELPFEPRIVQRGDQVGQVEAILDDAEVGAQ